MITCNELVQNYLHFLTNEFICETDGPYTVLTSPFMYHDGDNIVLYIEQYNDLVIVSDMGETARRLAHINFNWRLKSSRSLFATILNSTGTSSIKGKIFIKLSDLDDVGDKLNDLLHAIQQTDNLVFTVKEHSPQEFRDDVEIYLRKSGFEPVLNYQIDGDSGNLWRVHFYFNHNHNVLTKALSSNSKGGAKYAIQTTYPAYRDIKIRHPEMVRTIILDDSKDIWEPETINLTRQVVDTELGYWSKKEDFSNLLRELTN